MKRLWAPWRIEYIKMPKSGECIFCKAASSNNDKENLVVYRSRYSFIILNRFPYNSGHLMIVPYRHIPHILDLNDDEILDMFRLMKISIKALDSLMKPEGYNIGVNIGEAAGAGIKDHFHIHVVPRWSGDTNFMPVIGDTKVIVEALESVYENLKREIARVLKED